jgi:hypothetical protein
MRLKLISCEVIFREMCHAVSRSPHQIDVEFLPKGLHDLGGAKMREELQRQIDAVSASDYDAILLGYALCGNGIAGLEARAIPLVAPRAHDCIALLMGSRDRYAEYFSDNPGTYFRSTGWLERGKGLLQLVQDQTGTGLTLADLTEKYGEENARYLFEELTRYKSNYRKLAYIETGIEPDSRFVHEAQAEAGEKGWEFEVVTGSLDLFRRLANGEWDSRDFLVVPPGSRIAARYDHDVISIQEP